MSQPDFHDVLLDEARSLALELDLPVVAILKILPALSTAFFLGYKNASDRALERLQIYLGSQTND